MAVQLSSDSSIPTKNYNFAAAPNDNKSNSWTTSCTFGGIVLGSAECTIYSNPRIKFYGTGGSNVSAGIMSGTFGSDKSPEYLVANSKGSWGYIAYLFYTHFWMPDGWADLGGFGAGAGGGSHSYYVK